ncbi:hypothetical protein HD554DRAFT_712493 [Boletus coccyginus]|nr:hypothetical protein HD554DRAFT_712493 [Boletus coccyginus]
MRPTLHRSILLPLVVGCNFQLAARKMGGLQDQMVPTDPRAATLALNITYLFLGTYGWEYFGSCSVECALVCGRLAFRLSLIPYVLGRTSLLIYFILLVVGSSPYASGFSCIPGLTAIIALGSTALACSSTNFAVRTWVIWKDSRLVHALLLFLGLGQCTMFVIDRATSRVTNENGFCEIYFNYPQINVAVFGYTMVYDLLVSVLSIVALSRGRSESPLKRRLYTQSILYFVIAGITYIPPMVFVVLGDTSALFFFCNIALTVSTIVSSKAVRSLYSLDARDSGEASLESDVALTTQIMINSAHDRSQGHICGMAPRR